MLATGFGGGTTVTLGGTLWALASVAIPAVAPIMAVAASSNLRIKQSSPSWIHDSVDNESPSLPNKFWKSIEYHWSFFELPAPQNRTK
jgi:hypothetical protein